MGAIKKVTKTILFERAFGVDIRDFPTTEDVNKFVAKVRGKEIRIVNIETPFVEKRGCVFDIVDYDIDRMVDEAVRR